MSLTAYDLMGNKHDKVQTAIERLRAFEPEDGYYLAFSGGKDSQCIYHLAEMAGVKFDAHYRITSVDPPVDAAHGNCLACSHYHYNVDVFGHCINYELCEHGGDVWEGKDLWQWRGVQEVE